MGQDHNITRIEGDYVTNVYFLRAGVGGDETIETPKKARSLSMRVR
jgi:hypothetical protein